MQILHKLMCGVSKSNLINAEWNYDFTDCVIVNTELCIGRFMLKVSNFQDDN